MTSKRAAIRRATRELISERGFHGTPMSMIAEKAGVGAGTIHRSFDGKQDLITQLFLEIKRQKGEALLAGYSEELSLRERFRTLWLNMIRYYMDHPRETAFVEQFHNSPYMTAEVKLLSRDPMNPWRGSSSMLSRREYSRKCLGRGCPPLRWMWPSPWRNNTPPES